MKHTFRILAVLAVMLVFISTASAATFFAPRGSTITGVVAGEAGTITWSGFEVATVRQYCVDNEGNKGWVRDYKPAGSSVTVNPYDGDRVQLLNRKGEFISLTPEMAVSNYPKLKLIGMQIECSNPGGCTLQFK